ncbi:hypothetical protein DVH24_004559 [Malus domestica]|uniref:Thioredoxin domain-containing protein n=1 Tax=Malus domestica TaxID=3750 RepID=A0A498IEU3_MALDO|nr:hypothetical protein DVH24_004559 [Malus domestica]
MAVTLSATLFSSTLQLNRTTNRSSPHVFPAKSSNLKSSFVLNVNSCNGLVKFSPRQSAVVASAVSGSPGKWIDSSLSGEDAASLLETVKVFDLNGNGIPISDLWKDRTAVVAFARHFGCVFCRKRADYLASKKDIMDASGVALVLIGPGSTDQAKAFSEQTKFKGEVYADPTHSSYEALRFVSGVTTTFTPKAGLKIIELYMEGYRQDWKLSFEQDTVARGGWQQGGIIVAGPGKSNILYIHKDKEAGDDPDIKDILKACCVTHCLPCISKQEGRMAEFLTFAAEGILKRVALLAEQEFSLLWGFKKELTRLRDSLSKIQAMLRDAQQSHVRGETVEMWAKDLEDIALDADNVLDEYEYEVLRHKVELQNHMKKKVLNFFSHNNPVAFRLKMAHKIKNIIASLANLKNEAASIGLVARSTFVDATSDDMGVLDRETYIVGREEVVSEIVTTLINSSKNKENYLSVMAIVGLGGLGKTTLAKSIYHEYEIDRHFDKRIWICVSTPFKVKSILKGILEYLKPEKAAIQHKAAICENLQEDLRGKRYLLILDDVWNEDPQQWDNLMSCLLNVRDTQGSIIVVTTRSVNVASVVQTLPRHDLGKLSDEECWLVLKDKAFADRSASITEDQERIGREIAKKCAGVPLVAKVLGNMMRCRSDGWQSIQESTTWDIPEGEKRICSVLKLSFDELKSPFLKQCFAYCSMFTKDFEIEKDDVRALPNYLRLHGIRVIFSPPVPLL